MEEIIRRYGLWAVFFGTMIEGDLTLLLAGVLARAGVFSIEEALAVGTAGGFIGDSITYWIGSRFRSKAYKLKFFLKAKPRIEKLMKKFGVLSVFIVKFAYGLRTASALFWGLAHFGKTKFLLLTLASCLTWVGILVGIGFTFATGVEALIGDLKKVQIILLVVVVIVLIVYFIGRFERQVIEEGNGENIEACNGEKNEENNKE
jgi:membrane protein DedA with SNARE-associated domain